MKRQVIFLTKLYSPHIGGVETHVQKVAHELVAMDCAVTILTSQFDESLPTSEIEQGMRLVRIPFDTEASKIKTWKWIWQHKELFQEADVVHVHDVFWWTIPLLPIIKQKLFMTFHGWEGHFPLKKTAILQRRAAAQAAQGTIQVGSYIQKWYGTRPNIVTYGGVDFNAKSSKKTAQNVVRKIIDAAKKGDFFSQKSLTYSAIFLGRLSEDNDVRKVIEFFATWKLKEPRAKFLFVGDGELSAECESVGRVTGFVQDPEQYIQEAKIVCSSSYLSIMSAQLQKKLVVSFYSNPLKKDYLEGYTQSKNMIIASNAQEALTQVEALNSDKKRLQYMVSEAYGWVRNQTWQKVSDLYVTLWSRS